MSLLGAIAPMSRSELTVVLLGIGVIVGFTIWSFFRSRRHDPPTPDPWDGQVSAALDQEDCPQVCHSCLNQHDASVHFCPYCGAPVGACTNLMPPLYLYSIGDVFRAGIEGNYRHSAFLTGGFFFASFVAYVLVAPLFFLAPIYWFRLLRRIFGPRNTTEVDSQSPNSSP
jgi:hypothetical protein